MKYLLMCCIEENRWTALPQAERDGIMREYGQWVHDTSASGHYRAGAKLRGTAAATTVREKGGRPVITDGPFAETKEQLGGYHVLECKDLDEALSLARRIPSLRVGGAVEVRPIEAMSEEFVAAAVSAREPLVVV